jgi:hypothetical protein
MRKGELIENQSLHKINKAYSSKDILLQEKYNIWNKKNISEQ